MTRKGYPEELLAKEELSETYGKINIIKVAIGTFGGDFIVLGNSDNVIHKIVEVKACHQKKYHPSAREKEQFRRIESFALQHHIRAELWVKYPYKPFEKKQLA